jgi:hypothetical protein
LFLLVAKTLYIATRAVVATSDLSDITFLDGIKQQTFLQYADDTSFLLAEVEPNIQTPALCIIHKKDGLIVRHATILHLATDFWLPSSSGMQPIQITRHAFWHVS